MKKKLICLLLVLAMAAPLCACSMLDKEYVSIHDYVPSEQEQSLTGGKLTVHSYNALRSAILNMAYEGRSTGTIVFDPAYEGDPAEDLATACWTVRTEDALCAYCVENISYDFNKIVTVNEASIKLSYSKATESPKQIVHLGFSSEAEGAILSAMENGVRTLALLSALACLGGVLLGLFRALQGHFKLVGEKLLGVLGNRIDKKVRVLR